MATGWVWFDFENTPHVLFLEPIIRALAADGWAVRITAKPQAQTLELAESRGFAVEPIGAGDFVGLARKVSGTLGRAARLFAWAARHGRPRLLVSTSRSASLAARALGVPAMGMLDYEHAEQAVLAISCASIWFPDVLRAVRLPRLSTRIAHYYPGLKENLYLDSWPVDRAQERAKLGASSSDLVVVARPPADTAHYAAALSNRLWARALTGLSTRRAVRTLVVSRSAAQRRHLMEGLGALDRTEFLDHAVSGPGLVAAADLVVGGGGTMNREGAVLGIPVWSVFTGPRPAVDEQLAAEGRLRWIQSEEQLNLALERPLPRPMRRRGPFPEGLATIMHYVKRWLGKTSGRLP